MSSENEPESEIAGNNSISRRKFLKRTAAVVFAAPLIVSFALDASTASSAQTTNANDDSGAQSDADVSFGNQFGTHYFPNQAFSYGNQNYNPLAFENVTYPNQYSPNQASTLP